MKRTILGAIAALMLACRVSAHPPLVDGSGQVRALPNPGILLFWAAWCAPCRKEVDELAALERAAAPLPVVIVAVDPDRMSQRLLAHLPAAQVRFASTSDEILSMMMPGAGGALPAALALDSEGKACGRRQGGVTIEILRGWRELCAHAPVAGR